MIIKYILEFEERVSKNDIQSLSDGQLTLLKQYAVDTLSQLIKSYVSDNAENIQLHMEILEEDDIDG